MSSGVEAALRELEAYDSQEALAILEAVEANKRQTSYIKYWSPYKEGNQPALFKAFTPDKKVIGLLGGNRSGKTEVGAAIAIAWFLGKDYFKDEPAWEWVKDLPIPEPPNVIWVVGLDFPTVRDVLWGEKIRRGKDHPALFPSDPSLVKKISDSEYQILGTNGSLLTCKSADSGREKFQGASVDLVWIDEEPEVEIYDECYQRTVDCAGKILITLTPLTDCASGTKTPWVFDLWEEWKSGAKDLAFVYLSVLDNPYVPEEEKTRLKVKWAGHYEEKARLYGEFIQRSGLVYNQWEPKKHLIKPIPLPRSWRRVVCIDPAATGTTACLWCAVAPNSDLYFYREYYERDLVVSEHAKNILVRNGGDRIDLWLIDPKWGSQRNAETHKTNQQLYRDAQIPVRLAVVGEDYGLNASREYIQATVEPTSPHAKAYFFDDLKDFQGEIAHYVWDFFARGDQKGLSKDKPRKRNDHLMNSFQYICAQNPRPNRGSELILSPAEKAKFIQSNSYSH
jgi:phage terminase large subunit-like protein